MSHDLIFRPEESSGIAPPPFIRLRWRLRLKARSYLFRYRMLRLRMRSLHIDLLLLALKLPGKSGLVACNLLSGRRPMSMGLENRL